MKKESWMPSHQQGDKAEAKKYTGAKSNILRGEQKLPFGGGTMGVVSHERSSVTHNDKIRELDLVTKYFAPKTVGGPDGVESSMAAFQLLKNAGVRHIPVTYRRVGPSEILMTDYNRSGVVAVGGNDNEKAKDLCFDSISNFPELLASIGEDLQTAANANISLFSDSYFFIIPTSGVDAHVDFVIGDFGGVAQVEKFKPGGIDLYQASIIRVRSALHTFVSYHVVEDHQKQYEQLIRNWATTLEKKHADALANEAMDRGV